MTFSPQSRLYPDILNSVLDIHCAGDNDDNPSFFTPDTHIHKRTGPLSSLAQLTKSEDSYRPLVLLLQPMSFAPFSLGISEIQCNTAVNHR